MTEPEIREVPGLHGIGVDADGGVYSCWVRGRYPRLGETWYELQTYVDHGRNCVRLHRRREGTRQVYRVAELVLAAFGRAAKGAQYPWHKNGDVGDDRLVNLEWRYEQQRIESTAE